MAPFNNDYTSCLFASQDAVAIDSVGLDFLRTQWAYLWNVDADLTVDDYLHEAALANNPPSGTFYDPDHATGVQRLASLGVHEHWNNAVDMKYSRNLGTGAGIELIIDHHPTGVPPPREELGLRLWSRPNPFNPRTTIRFDLPAAGQVRLAVYDVAGRLIRVLVDGELFPGTHEAVWDGRGATGRAMASGTYLARLEAGGKVETVRMGLVR